MFKHFSKLIVPLFAMFVMSINAFAGDILITRDGKIKEVTLGSINAKEVSVKNGRRISSFPTDVVFMVLREKGTSYFFDEEGNQMTIKPPKFDPKKDNLVFKNDGTILIVYNLTVNKSDITYKMSDKKKAPLCTTEKNEVFMIKCGKDETMLINNNYINRSKTSANTQSIAPASPAPQVPDKVEDQILAQDPTQSPDKVLSQIITQATTPEAKPQPSVSRTRSSSWNKEHPSGGIEISFLKPEEGWGYEYYVGGIGEYFFLDFGMIYGKDNEYIRNQLLWKLGGGLHIRKYLTDFLYLEGRTGIFYGHNGYEYVSGYHTESGGVSVHWSHEVKDWSKQKDGNAYFNLRPAIGVDFSEKWGIIIGYDLMWYKFKLNSDNRGSFWTFGISLNI